MITSNFLVFTTITVTVAVNPRNIFNLGSRLLITITVTKILGVTKLLQITKMTVTKNVTSNY